MMISSHSRSWPHSRLLYFRLSFYGQLWLPIVIYSTMIKAHKRKNSGSMRRASRVYLTEANVGKVAALKDFLLLYVNVVNYFIERFWSMTDFTAALADKVITSRAVNRFKITARLAQ